MNNPSKEEIYAFLGPVGAMIGGSKSGYRKANPLNVAIFNANVCFVKENIERKLFGLIKKKTYTAEKIWWGDFDLTKNWKALKNLAEATGETVVILYEMDGRFENENAPLWEKFIYMVTPGGKESLGQSIMPYVMWTDESITYIPEETESIDAVEAISNLLQNEIAAEPAPADVQPTSEAIAEATAALDEAIAAVKEKTAELKEKKPRAPRKPKSETTATTAEKPARKPRKPKGESVTDSETEVVKKPRAPRKKKENNG